MSKMADRIRLQVMWNRLLAIVEEQAQTLVRTSFSVSTREAGDVSAGVFDVQGRMLAQAETGTPGHINSMALAVPHFLKKFPLDTMRPGDCFLTNDPWQGTGHLHDFTFVSPAFHGDKVVALFACTAHVVDIGGIGFNPDGRQVYHEGLRVPIMRFADAGQVDSMFIEIVRNNVRESIQVEGDLYALAACNTMAAKALNRLMSEYQVGALEDVGTFILESTDKAMREAIAILPRGRATYVMRTDGYDYPIDLACSVEIGTGEVTVDFTGTSGVSNYGINCPMCYTTAYASFAIKCVIAPKIPNNHASLALIKISAPENTIVNALFPCAVAVRSVIGHLIPDTVFGCLHQLLPNEVPAEGAGSLWGLKAGAGHGLTNMAFKPSSTTFMMMSLHSGGAGARPALDGLSATPFPSGVKNVPIEVTEAITPLVVWKKELRMDSGGAGRHRGGLGQTMVIGNREPEAFAVFATFDRVANPPMGREGGLDGARGSISLASGATLRAKGRQTVPEGDSVVLEMPGGAGYGDPKDRNLEAIENDLVREFISWEAAQRDYGVERDAQGQLVRL